MSGSTFGNQFRVTTWGESHGAGIGAVIDGCPAGLPLSEEDIQPCLDRRRPGQNAYTTARREKDAVTILSGVFEGRTTGTPISLLIRNEDQRSKDYSALADVYRPGHADLGFDAKYGLRDYRGGGRSSGRETIGRVAAGAVAAKVLRQLGIEAAAYTQRIGPVECNVPEAEQLRGRSAAGTHLPDAATQRSLLQAVRERSLLSPLAMPDAEADARAQAWLQECIRNQDSSGGCVECLVTGLPAGIGDPVFDKLDARLAQAIVSIGAVKGVEFGDGFGVSTLTGSENNDRYTCAGGAELSASDREAVTSAVSADGTSADEGTSNAGSVNDVTAGRRPVKCTNHAGGILGGMSDGSPLILRAAFKPTPSIAQPQSALAADGTLRDLTIHGRHDPVIMPRAAVVVESMTLITILDLLLTNLGARMDHLTKIYL